MAVSISFKLKAPTSDHGQNYTDHIHNVKRLHAEGKDFESRGSVFKELLESNLPDNEKTIDRLGAEAGSLIGAGTETTSRSMVSLGNGKPLKTNIRNSTWSDNFLPSYAAIGFNQAYGRTENSCERSSEFT
jgi:hypothetical protein